MGVGPGGPKSLNRVLFDRFKDHTSGNAGSSTFRLVLASFLFKQQRWKPEWTSRAQLTKADNAALNAWQATYLRAQWVEVAKPWESEAAVIAAMKPPLNRTHNESHPFYDKVGASREAYRGGGAHEPAQTTLVQRS